MQLGRLKAAAAAGDRGNDSGTRSVQQEASGGTRLGDALVLPPSQAQQQRLEGVTQALCELALGAQQQQQPRESEAAGHAPGQQACSGAGGREGEGGGCGASLLQCVLHAMVGCPWLYAQPARNAPEALERCVRAQYSISALKELSSELCNYTCLMHVQARGGVCLGQCARVIACGQAPVCVCVFVCVCMPSRRSCWTTGA